MNKCILFYSSLQPLYRHKSYEAFLLCGTRRLESVTTSLLLPIHDWPSHYLRMSGDRAEYILSEKRSFLFKMSSVLRRLSSSSWLTQFRHRRRTKPLGRLLFRAIFRDMYACTIVKKSRLRENFSSTLLLHIYIIEFVFHSSLFCSRSSSFTKSSTYIVSLNINARVCFFYQLQISKSLQLLNTSSFLL